MPVRKLKPTHALAFEPFMPEVYHTRLFQMIIIKRNTMKFVQRLLPILLVVLLTYWANAPLLHRGFFPIQDDEQVGRLYELNLDVRTGQLPPRLAQDLGYGYDYPLFNFYPPFAYYVSEVYHLLGFSYIDSIKMMIATGFILAAIAMYVLAKEYFGKFAGVVSSVFYTYASYHSVDVYVRGALPEFWAFVFLPATFWMYARLAKKPKTYLAILTGIVLGCFVLTHNLIAMMSGPFIFCFLVYLYFTTHKKKPFVFMTLLSGLVGVGLTAYFWLPELVEKHFTMVSLLTKELASYALYFVYPIQFWYSPWGYGGGVAGNPLANGLSVQIGRIYFFALAAVLGYALFLLKKSKKTAVLLFLLLALFLFSLYMQVAQSKMIWDALQSVMAYIQFPWRFLLISNFLAAFAIGALFMRSERFFKNTYIKYVQYGVGILLIFLVVYKAGTIFRPQTYFEQAKDSDYISKDVLSWKTSNLSFEYVPKGIATKTSDLGNTIVDITHAQIEHSPFSVVSGSMNVQTTKDIPQQKTAQVLGTKNGILQINVYDFPGWQVLVDGHRVQYTANNPLRLLQIPLSQGQHTIVATFTDTPVRSVGNALSAFTILLILLYCAYPVTRKIMKRYII
jgi:hypothetical protein